MNPTLADRWPTLAAGAFLVGAGAVGVATGMVPEALLAAVVVVSIAAFLFTYPF
jgi:hypothetical protein